MTALKEIKSSDNNDQMSDTPPLFRKWSDIYLLVMAVLFILIGLFYVFSISFK